MVHISTIPRSHPLWQLATSLPVHLVHVTVCQQQRHAPSENILLLRSLIKDFPPYPLFSLLLRLGHRVVDIYYHRFRINMLPHPAKSTALFDQWLISWMQDTLVAISNSDFSICINASFNGQGMASVAFVVPCFHNCGERKDSSSIILSIMTLCFLADSLISFLDMHCLAAIDKNSSHCKTNSVPWMVAFKILNMSLYNALNMLLSFLHFLIFFSPKIMLKNPLIS